MVLWWESAAVGLIKVVTGHQSEVTVATRDFSLVMVRFGYVTGGLASTSASLRPRPLLHPILALLLAIASCNPPALPQLTK